MTKKTKRNTNSYLLAFYSFLVILGGIISYLILSSKVEKVSPGSHIVTSDGEYKAAVKALAHASTSKDVIPGVSLVEAKASEKDEAKNASKDSAEEASKESTAKATTDSKAQNTVQSESSKISTADKAEGKSPAHLDGDKANPFRPEDEHMPTESQDDQEANVKKASTSPTHEEAVKYVPLPLEEDRMKACFMAESVSKDELAYRHFRPQKACKAQAQVTAEEKEAYFATFNQSASDGYFGSVRDLFNVCNFIAVAANAREYDLLAQGKFITNSQQIFTKDYLAKGNYSPLNRHPDENEHITMAKFLYQRIFAKALSLEAQGLTGLPWNFLEDKGQIIVEGALPYEPSNNFSAMDDYGFYTYNYQSEIIQDVEGGAHRSLVVKSTTFLNDNQRNLVLLGAMQANGGFKECVLFVKPQSKQNALSSGHDGTIRFSSDEEAAKAAKAKEKTSGKDSKTDAKDKSPVKDNSKAEGNNSKAEEKEKFQEPAKDKYSEKEKSPTKD